MHRNRDLRHEHVSCTVGHAASFSRGSRTAVHGAANEDAKDLQDHQQGGDTGQS